MRGDVMGLNDLHLEISPFLELLEVARQHEWPHLFQVSVGEDIARFELRLGVLVLVEPVVKSLLRIGSGVTTLLGPGAGLPPEQAKGRNHRERHESLHNPSLREK